MKKLLLIPVFLLSVLIMNAQGLHFGPRVGMNMSKILIKDLSSEHSYITKNVTNVGYQIGATAELEIFKFMYLGTTISLFKTGTNYKTNWSTMKENFTNIKVPIHFGYKLPLGNVSLFGNIGPYVSVAMFGKTRYVYPEEEEWEEGQPDSTYEMEFGEETSYYKRLDAGISVGAGADFKQWQTRINYSFGLRDVTTENWDDVYAVTSVLNVSLAYFLGRSE